MSRLRWGILSTGRIAHKFARAVLRSQKGEIAAVASRTTAKAEEFAKQYHIPCAHGSYEALLADPNVDVAYIATPHAQHREWAVRAAHAKKHILCEKPLGLHHDEAVEILQAVWENGVFFMEAYMYRCHPQIAKTLELLRDGVIGDVRTITARFGFRAGHEIESRLFGRELGGGGILAVGGYCTSMARLIAGAARGAVVEPEKVFAVGQIGMESGVDEYAAALLLFPHDVVATLSCGLLLNQENKIRIEGAEGAITLPNPWLANVDGGETQIVLEKDGAAPEILTITSAPLYALEADLVADSIAEGRVEAAWPAMTWADTLGNIRAQDQWRRALDSTGPSFAEPPGKGTQVLPFITWQQRFSRLFQASAEKYQSGHTKAVGLVDAKGQKFLASIGCTEQEFFDFVEDFSRGGEPTLETALDLAAVRRDYFLKQQNGVPSPHRIIVDQLPAKDAEVQGIPWLPRLLPKAEAKLRGEMPPELMYCCGGDRKFFKTHHLDAAEFLRRVWKAQGSHADVIAWVEAESKAQN